MFRLISGIKYNKDVKHIYLFHKEVNLQMLILMSKHFALCLFGVFHQTREFFTPGKCPHYR